MSGILFRSFSHRKLLGFSIYALSFFVICCKVYFHDSKYYSPNSHYIPSMRYRTKNFSGPGSKTGNLQIPKIIHQTWKSNSVPIIFEKWIGSWLKHNPDYEYWLWQDFDIDNLIASSFPYLQSEIGAYPAKGYKIDAFRYMLLYVHGGVYADIDMESISSINLLLKNSCVISQEPEEHAVFLSPVGVPLLSNAFMACSPKHPFMLHLIKSLKFYKGGWQWNDILTATGPYFLTRSWETFAQTNKKNIYIPPSRLVHPTIDSSMLDIMRSKCLGDTYTNDDYERLCNKITSFTYQNVPQDDSLTMHHWTHTWAGPKFDPWGIYNMRVFSDFEKILASFERISKN